MYDYFIGSILQCAHVAKYIFLWSIELHDFSFQYICVTVVRSYIAYVFKFWNQTNVVLNFGLLGFWILQDFEFLRVWIRRSLNFSGFEIVGRTFSFVFDFRQRKVIVII